MSITPIDTLKQSIEPSGRNTPINPSKPIIAYTYRNIRYFTVDGYRKAKLVDVLQCTLSHRKDAKELIAELLPILTLNIHNLNQIPEDHITTVYKSHDGKFFSTDSERIKHEHLIILAMDI